MTAMNARRSRGMIVILSAGMMALCLVGCGGDDDNPTSPGGGSGTISFDESAARTQAQTAGPQSVNLVESMITLARGFTKEGEGDYSWNEESLSWEYHYSYSEPGYGYDLLYTVQYLGAGGVPQEGPLNAVTISHDMNGTGQHHYESQGVILDYEYVYEYATQVTGLGTDTLVMTGGGKQDVEYSYKSPQDSFSSSFVVKWAILAPGITINVPDGCPAGTIRYDFLPYYARVVFDGTDSASSTLYDGSGSPVAGAEYTYPLSCEAP